MQVSQTVECPLTRQDTGILGWNLSTENGNGSGVFIARWRRLLASRSLVEVSSHFLQ